MGRLLEIALESNEKRNDEFNSELAKLVADLSIKYGLPKNIVLNKAVEVVNKRAEPFECDIRIPVLKKDDDWENHVDKLLEEAIELIDEIEYIEKDLFEEVSHECIVEEALDVVQVCIGILDKVESEYPGTIKKNIQKHYIKLLQRGWKVKEILKVGIE